MSLLGSIRGRPPQLWEVIKMLQAAGGTLEKDALQRWLQPGLQKYSGSLLDNTLSVGASLGLVELHSAQVSLTSDEPILSIGNLADVVHRRLSKAKLNEPDRVILLTYAWFAVKCEMNGGSEWLDSFSIAELADSIDQDLRQGESAREQRLFNKFKWASWKAWVEFTGLSARLGVIDSFYPSVTERLQRELIPIGSEFGIGVEIAAASIFERLALAMPYLDGGEHFGIISSNTNWNQPSRQLTWLLSNGLRNLHDLKRVQLQALGDTSSAFALRPDPLHHISFVKTIVLEESLLK